MRGVDWDGLNVLLKRERKSGRFNPPAPWLCVSRSNCIDKCEEAGVDLHFSSSAFREAI